MPSPDAWLPFLSDSYAVNRFSNFGPASQLLERRLAEKFTAEGRSFVLTCNGTSGLTAVLLALNIRGRVALPAFTFPATLQAIRMAGCMPVLCDVDPVTWEMSPATLEPILSEEPLEAVVPVRAFGFCRDQRPLVSLCAQADIPVIFDSAAALGGRLDSGCWAGGQGIAEVFSLHATKVFGIGEGGVISVDSAVAQHVRSALNFGIAPDRIDRGLNGKLNEFSAAVGLAVLDRVDGFIVHRRYLAARYSEALARYPSLTLPTAPGNAAWQSYPFLLPEDCHTGEFVEQTLQAGLEVRRYYYPALHLADDGDANSRVPVSIDVSRQLANRMVCLPVYSDMSTEEQDEVLRIVDAVLSSQ